jgi:hypothetical protein
LLPTRKYAKVNFEDIGKKQYGYLVFDGCPKGYANARIRTGIFPEDETVIYDL